jgi:hypothetical protein
MFDPSKWSNAFCGFALEGDHENPLVFLDLETIWN